MRSLVSRGVVSASHPFFFAYGKPPTKDLTLLSFIMTLKIFRIPSSSHYGITYEVTSDNVKKEVSCDCKSGQIRGYCKHIRYFKRIIERHMHETPRV